MFNVRQLYPLLLAAFQKLDSINFTILLKCCSVISFRYNVIGNLAANEQERIYNKVAINISNVYRLGNMTILNKAVNRAIGNSSFQVKAEKYLESEFQITKRIASENTTWNPNRIKVHQNWLAKQATAIWRISQLD